MTGPNPPRTRGLALVLVAVSLMAFLQFFEGPRGNLLWRSAMDAGHVPLFGVFSLVTLGLIRIIIGGRKAPPLLPYVLAFLITGGVAALMEVLQFYGPRDADPVDLARSLAGASSFLGLALAFDKESLGASLRRPSSTRTASWPISPPR